MVLYREKFHKPQVFLGVGVCVEIDGEGEAEVSFSGAIGIKHSCSFYVITL